MARSLDGGTHRTERNIEERVVQAPERDCCDARTQESKTVYHLRGQTYRLNPRQASTLRDIGTFRIVTANSLQKHVYHGEADRFRNDLRSLAHQRLLTVQPNPRDKDQYVSLNRVGKDLTETHLRTNTEQSLYSGIVKKRELRHDAAIYEVYQKEAKKISKSGGKIKRIVLDFELKKNVNRQLANIQNLSPIERERQRQEIAESHGLKIVKGKMRIPDLRIEYESREQEQSRVDLECVTGHYKARQIAAKTAAGFKLYNQDYRCRSAERGEDLVGEVISL